MNFSQKTAITALAYFLSISPSQAQIEPDISLLNKSIVRQEGNTVIIEGGTQSGSNLFHSLQELSVGQGIVLEFKNSSNVQNIFTRITGNLPSNINGTIKANGIANLFLINPKGFVFGENARLNLDGSFFATTATGVKFADGLEFSATNPYAPPILLTINTPIGLQFGEDPSPIIIQGTGSQINRRSDFAQFSRFTGLNNSIGLRVQPGKNLILIGGDIFLDGGIIATEGGRIDLGSVSTSGNVGLDISQDVWSLDYEKVKFGDISLSKKALIDVSGTKSGSIEVHGSHINLADGSVFLIQNSGSLKSGDIGIYASETLQVEGISSDQNITSIATESVSDGEAGSIAITAKNLLLENGGGITTGAFSNGRSGDINIKISNSLQLFRTPQGLTYRKPSNITASTLANGNAGLISIFSPQIKLFNGAVITSKSLGIGDAGNININSKLLELDGTTIEDDLFTFINTGTFKQGNAGDIIINTSQLKLTNGASISSASITSGAAGNVRISAKNSVQLMGIESKFSNPSSINSSVNIEENENFRNFLGIPLIPSGFSGDVTINTPSLKIQQGEISSKNEGTGNGGVVNIESNTANIKDGAIVTAAARQGGNIAFKARNIQLNNATISANAGQQDSGNGNGGNVDIRADILLNLQSSVITANAYAGKGGNINIFAPIFLVSRDSRLEASSQLGIDGEIKINSSLTNFNFTQLAPQIVAETPKIASYCQGQSDVTRSEFIITGVDKLPPSPNEVPSIKPTWQDKFASSETINNLEQPKLSTKEAAQIVEAQGWVRDSSGNVILTAEANSAIPYAVSSANLCSEEDINTTASIPSND
jgi:filamentous hemagglutinin family protein